MNHTEIVAGGLLFVLIFGGCPNASQAAARDAAGTTSSDAMQAGKDAAPPHAKPFLVAKTGWAPSLSVTPKGEVLLVYKGTDRAGATRQEANGLYFTKTASVGGAFDPPVKVAEFTAMIAGMRREPQVASDGRTLLITGVERRGFVVRAFRSEDGGKTWSGPARVNSPRSRNGEGLYSLTASPSGSFHVVWLDSRQPGSTQIWHARSIDGGRTWSEKNAYPVDGGSVCECCWPFITADARGKLYLLFRNNLGNIRDMHVVESLDDGQTWQTRSRKLGSGTWNINACPVQGGSMAFSPDDQPVTIWGRQGRVFTSGLSGEETSLGRGRNPSIAVGPDGPYALWEEGAAGPRAKGAINVKEPGGNILRFREGGTQEGGPFATSSVIAGHPRSGVVAAWEENGAIHAVALAEPQRHRDAGTGTRAEPPEGPPGVRAKLE